MKEEITNKQLAGVALVLAGTVALFTWWPLAVLAVAGSMMLDGQD